MFSTYVYFVVFAFLCCLLVFALDTVQLDLVAGVVRLLGLFGLCLFV